MDSFTARETICRSTTSDVLWIIHLCRRFIVDNNFWWGGTGKGLIIKAWYWGLKIPASEVSGDRMTWNYRKSDCHTSGRGTLDWNSTAQHLKSWRVYVCVLRISFQFLNQQKLVVKICFFFTDILVGFYHMCSACDVSMTHLSHLCVCTSHTFSHLLALTHTSHTCSRKVTHQIRESEIANWLQ